LPINHLEGHIYANFVRENSKSQIPNSPPKADQRIAGKQNPSYKLLVTNPQEILFPAIVLIVSGGHTMLILMKNHLQYQILGETLDDAAGEAFDKAAKLLKLGYPGGLVIDRLAKSGNAESISFPRAMKGSLDFSFSGLKTSLLTMMKRAESSGEWKETKDVAASFQEAIVDTLVDKTINAAEKIGVRRIVVCGGVAANSRLREKFAVETQSRSIELFMPPGVLCTDNAAMIAAMGEIMLKAGYRDTLDMNAVSRWPVSAF